MNGISSRPWEFKSDSTGLTPDEKSTLRAELGISSVALQVCLNRGITERDAIQKFLNPNLSDLIHPFELHGMSAAVDRIAAARNAGEKVMIFGDYDVDGTCGAALLSLVFQDFGISAVVRQPDRFTEGYGLSTIAVKEALNQGIKLIISVDCGITSFDAGDEIQKNQMDWIIVDHHQTDSTRGLPTTALAIVNPQQAACFSELGELCGCGLAFYLSMGLRIRARDEKWFTSDDQLPNLKQHLDLVVLATAADQVPLLKINRILVTHGLEVLRRTKKWGLKALLDKTGISAKAKISPGVLGFVLGPRINASGRMGSASTALRLLTTKNQSEAYRLAGELESINESRMKVQNEIWDEIRKRLELEVKDGLHKNAVVIGDRGWHEGVIGIVASRICDLFHRPAIVISIGEEGAKGSVRSYGGKNVLEALHQCKEFLQGYGGHKFAAGLSLDPANLIKLQERFDSAVATLGDPIVEPLMIEGEFLLGDFDIKTLRDIEALAPFGPGHSEPIFMVKGAPNSRQILKGRHLKVFIEGLEAMWFNGAENKIALDKTNPDCDEADKSQYAWAGIPEINRFRGNAKPSFRIKDLATPEV